MLGDHDEPRSSAFEITERHRATRVGDHLPWRPTLGRISIVAPIARALIGKARISRTRLGFRKGTEYSNAQMLKCRWELAARVFDAGSSASAGVPGLTL